MGAYTGRNGTAHGRLSKTVGIDTLDQAYAAPAESLLGRQADYMAAEFSPYVDGDLLPEPLRAGFLAGHVYDVPVLLGLYGQRSNCAHRRPASSDSRLH